MSQTCRKLAVVGSGGVGKSALTLRLVKQTFCEQYDPTIEDSYRKQVEIDGQTSLLEIFDTAGQEELSALRDQALRAAEGFLVVFSLTERESFKGLEELRQSIYRAKDSEKVPLVVVGNKCDLEEQREVEESDASALAEQWKVPYFSASAKVPENVEESFFELVREVRRQTGGGDPSSPEGGTTKKKPTKVCNLL